MSIRNIAQGGLLICLSAILQLLPAFFGGTFVIATVFSAIPIYILSRSNPYLGLAGYIVAGGLIILFNPHEGMFFLFTNGPVGFSLGAFSNILKSKLLISIFSGIVLTLHLSTVEFIIGIPVLGINMPEDILVKIRILMIFSILYCFIYLLFANSIYNYLKIRYPFI